MLFTELMAKQRSFYVAIRSSQFPNSFCSQTCASCHDHDRITRICVRNFFFQSYRYSLISVGVVLSVGILVSLLSGRSRWASPSRKYVHKLVWCFVRNEEKEEEERRRREDRLASSEAMKRKEAAAAVNQAATIEGSTAADVDHNVNMMEPDLETGEYQMTRF